MKDIQNWVDPAMFASEKHKASEGPIVHLLSMNSDPLGNIAACAKMYKGEVVRDLSRITDEERHLYLGEMQKTKLAMPLESVTMHFMLENVTRAFTHQMVRQRTAAYAQESMRFAVVEDMSEAVALPPSLAGTYSTDEWYGTLEKEGVAFKGQIPDKAQMQRFGWDTTVRQIGAAYMTLVDGGMPAEDARGLMPTNIVTRINYITGFRALLDHAGNRLCTQAQFEWRAVFAQIKQAMRDYGKMQFYSLQDKNGYITAEPSGWQFNALADLLMPICYQTGKCAFKADFDRSCKIRDRVDAFEDSRIMPMFWGQKSQPIVDENDVILDPIDPQEWLLDPKAAR